MTNGRINRISKTKRNVKKMEGISRDNNANFFIFRQRAGHPSAEIWLICLVMKRLKASSMKNNDWI